MQVDIWSDQGDPQSDAAAEEGGDGLHPEVHFGDLGAARLSAVPSRPYAQPLQCRHRPYPRHPHHVEPRQAADLDFSVEEFRQRGKRLRARGSGERRRLRLPVLARVEREGRALAVPFNPSLRWRCGAPGLR